MPTKKELQEQLKKDGVEFKSDATKADLERLAGDQNKSANRNKDWPETENVEEVEVNPNEDGEAKFGTTKEGQEDPVENTESVPQNGVTEITTTPAPNDIAKEADEARTKEEIKFADESNPNQKARVASAPSEFDQDGNERGGGKSYGVAAEDLRNVDLKDIQEFNKGEKQEPEGDPKDEPVFQNRGEQVDTINQNDTNNEMSEENQKALEEKLSRPEDNISARVTTSVGHNLRVKFFRRGLPFVIYKSRAKKLDVKEVNAFLDRQLELRGE